MVLKPYFLFLFSRSQVTLTQVLQIQDQLCASLRNPSAAMQELAGETLPFCHVVISPQESPERGGGGSTEMCGTHTIHNFGLGSGGNWRGWN